MSYLIFLCTDSNISPLSSLTISQMICTAIFLLAMFTQFKCSQFLAKLYQVKKTANDDIPYILQFLTMVYEISRNDLFVFTTFGIQLTEVLIYIALSGILFKTTTLHYLTIAVTINQVLINFVILPFLPLIDKKLKFFRRLNV